MYHFIDDLTFNIIIIELDRSSDTTDIIPLIKKVNSSASTLLGYGQKELTDKPLDIICTPETWQTTLARLNDDISCGSLEGELVTKTNKRIPVLISLSVLPGQNPKKTGIVLLIQDISDRKELDKIQLMMHRAVEQSASAVLITDKNGLIEYINPKFSEISGYTSEELLGKNPKIMQSGNTPLEHYQSMWQNLLNTGEWCGEIKNQKKNGDDYWVYECVSAIKNNQDEVTHFLALEEDITERKRLEHRFRQAVESAPNAIVMVNEAGTIEMVNSQTETFFGYSRDELIGQPVEMLVPERFRSAHIGYRQAYLAAPVSRPMGVGRELYGLRKDGTEFPVEIGLSLIDNNEETLILSSILDITQRKEAESALKESEERFRQMAEMTGEWLWEQDPGGYYIYSSTAVNQILGFSQDEVMGKHYTEFLTPQDKAEQQVYATSYQPFYALTNHYRHKDGHPVLAESTGLPIINAEGKLLKWRGVDRDITARKHFQDALIESEKRTRLIIESSLSAIVIMDSYGLITDWNHQAEKIFGWARKEAIGQRLEELIIPPRYRNEHRQGLQTFLHTGIGPLLNKLIEHVAMRRDGSEFPVEFSISPLKLGNAYIFSGFIHEITARKAAEQKIRQAEVNLAIAQSEIKIAQRIQASLSPSAPIRSDHFEVTGYCLPADQVGGDYFDYFFRSEDQLDMIIADVSGHSIGPALFMVETRSAIRTQANRLGTPSETLGVLNNFLFEDLDNADYFITLFYLQYNTRTHQLSFANAGHPPPLLLSPFQRECRQLDAEGMILGVRKNIIFEEKTTTISNGDLILLYTDGITEAENPVGEFFGVERLSDIFIQYAQHSPEGIIDAMLKHLKQFCQCESFNDDITLMIFRRG
ncbi:MAG: PAS domain S-box protein [Methylococcaceae bacterium]|nr:PAS domain S-box protein [Methylococcaceae bacterium]OYV19670.1 MAG: PAS/PAC sensor protein [Methylococcaceae bacterium NSM2-1]